MAVNKYIYIALSASRLTVEARIADRRAVARGPCRGPFKHEMLYFSLSFTQDAQLLARNGNAQWQCSCSTLGTTAQGAARVWLAAEF